MPSEPHTKDSFAWWNRQEKAVRAVQKLGGEVRFDYELDDSGELIQVARPPGPFWTRRLLGDRFFSHVQTVDLSNMPKHEYDFFAALPNRDLWRGPFGDEALAPLRRFKDLRSLCLQGNRITDHGLSHLRRLHRLQSLNLALTEVTDVGLEHVGRFRQLIYLNLAKTRVSDAGLNHLTQLRCLRCLSLSHTRVSDVGLSSLEGLPSLEMLDLTATGVSDSGVARLQQGLPTTTIVWGTEENVHVTDE